jgi:hypothetical protein
MRPVLAAIASHALAQFAALFGGLDADAEYLNLFGNVSFGFVDKGRHLGPAPGSPPAAVEEHNGCRGFGECGRKVNGRAVDVVEFCGRKNVAEF